MEAQLGALPTAPTGGTPTIRQAVESRGALVDLWFGALPTASTSWTSQSPHGVEGGRRDAAAGSSMGAAVDGPMRWGLRLSEAAEECWATSPASSAFPVGLGVGGHGSDL